MRFIYLAIILFTTILYGCSKVRESAGVNRKQIDEFQVLENPPLVIPPDFNLLPPDQLKAKNIDNIDKDLAKEILFGLEDNNLSSSTNVSTMNQILSNAEAFDVSDSIKKEIDYEFSKEVDTIDIYQVNFDNEIEILDAIKESERIRNKKFDGDSIVEGEIPIKKTNIKNKKKKRFLFF